MVDLRSLSLVTITSLSMGFGTVYELHFICYMFSFLSELRVRYNILFCLICFVNNSFPTVYLTTCMYPMRKFALCECYCLFLLLFADVLSPFLCKCVLVSVVYFSLQMCCGLFM